LARQAVENYLSKVTDNERLKETDLHAMRKELLESALPFYEQFAKEESDDPEQAAERGRAYYRLAQVRFLLGESERMPKASFDPYIGENPGHPFS
jgi:hypothetical protein